MRSREVITNEEGVVEILHETKH